MILSIAAALNANQLSFFDHFLRLSAKIVNIVSIKISIVGKKFGSVIYTSLISDGRRSRVTL